MAMTEEQMRQNGENPLHALVDMTADEASSWGQDTADLWTAARAAHVVWVALSGLTKVGVARDMASTQMYCDAYYLWQRIEDHGADLLEQLQLERDHGADEDEERSTCDVCGDRFEHDQLVWGDEVDLGEYLKVCASCYQRLKTPHPPTPATELEMEAAIRTLEDAHERDDFGPGADGAYAEPNPEAELAELRSEYRYEDDERYQVSDAEAEYRASLAPTQETGMGTLDEDHYYRCWSCKDETVAHGVFVARTLFGERPPCPYCGKPDQVQLNEPPTY